MADITLTASDGFELGAYRADPAGTPRGGIVVNALLTGLYRRGGSVSLPWGTGVVTAGAGDDGRGGETRESKNCSLTTSFRHTAGAASSAAFILGRARSAESAVKQIHA
mgnify:CR=1 FL=1